MDNIGQLAEQMAKHYLQQQGLTAVAQNFHSRRGEIDLIMQDGHCLVFVEVKYRKQATYGHANEMISFQKQQKIRHTAQLFLQQRALNAYNTDCRFDVIAIEGNLQSATIQWLKNAF